MKLTTTIASVALLSLAGCLGPQGTRWTAQPVRPVPTSIRAVWVTRFDFRTAEDIARVMANCRAAGFNTVMFQVRGAGTAWYRSRLEPWADELGGRDPGFDPLAVACDQAHRQDLSLHAWVNVMPAWRGTQPPRDPQQLYNAHPDWFWYDQSGRRQPLNPFYVSLNPCRPEVRDYLTSVCQEIVARYPVDGLHLDYVRFPSEAPAVPTGGRVDYPRDPRTVALFTRQTGRHPDRDRAAWDRWRAAQITLLVSQIGQMLDKARPQAVFSTAVGQDPAAHLQDFHQDIVGWMRTGLIDFVVPMNYTYDDAEFARSNQAFLAQQGRCRVIPGMSLELDSRALPAAQSPGHAARQIAGALRQAGHVCVFAYSHLYERAGEAPSALQAARRQAVRQVLAGR